MSQCERKRAESLQARTGWFHNYELMCKEADHLMSLYGQKYAEAKILRLQVEKAIRVIEQFLDIAKLPLTANMEKFVEPLEEFVVEAKAELKLWEDKK